MAVYIYEQIAWTRALQAELSLSFRPRVARVFSFCIQKSSRSSRIRLFSSFERLLWFFYLLNQDESCVVVKIVTLLVEMFVESEASLTCYIVPMCIEP